jgi:hypothetical protein
VLKQRGGKAAIIARKPVSCTPISLDQYGRTVATCSVAGIDWPAPGSEDTELRCLMEQEAGHGEATVYAGVQG